MTSPIITEAVRALVDRRDLTRLEAAGAMEAIMSGAATNAQIAAFLTALRMKGETVEELIGFAQVMRQKAVKVRASGADLAQTGTDREMLIDTCGTGGDASGTFNVSTATAFVVAGAGVKVAKHGNRSVSSLCGSADVVETLGIDIELSPPKVARCVDEVGIGFLYAPLLHTAMKHVMAARREMGVRTVFNMLGPLTNPAGAANQLVGVFHPDLVGIHVRVLQRLGSKHVLVVYGRDGMDEVSLGAATMVGELKDGEVREYEIHPEDFGLHMKSNRGLKVDGAAESKAMVEEALANVDGTPREIVVFNAGAALYTAGIAGSIAEGIERARESIASGSAKKKLDAFVETTQKLGAKR